MFADFLGAFGDVFGRNIRKNLFLSAFLTAAAWGVLLWICWIVTGLVSVSETAWLAQTVRILGFLAVFVASLFLLPALAGGIASLFAEKMLKTLSAQDKNTVFHDAPVGASLKISGRAAAKSIANAVVFTPLCFVFAFVPFVNAVPVLAYYWAAGRAAGYEYFMTTALCFMPPEQAEKIYTDNKNKISRAGTLIAFLMTIPVINVISPLTATAFMRRILLKIIRTEK